MEEAELLSMNRHHGPRPHHRPGPAAALLHEHFGGGAAGAATPGVSGDGAPLPPQYHRRGDRVEISTHDLEAPTPLLEAKVPLTKPAHPAGQPRGPS